MWAAMRQLFNTRELFPPAATYFLLPQIDPSSATVRSLYFPLWEAPTPRNVVFSPPNRSDAAQSRAVCLSSPTRVETVLPTSLFFFATFPPEVEASLLRPSVCRAGGSLSKSLVPTVLRICPSRRQTSFPLLFRIASSPCLPAPISLSPEYPHREAAIVFFDRMS